ncbi:MAG: hypothetical protein BSOLF_1033 [Candidatus Carbobacillus altaicus]|uniref:AMP-dependent synthetase/ligase domain-containing protein n=1 Tax=Candidatus Carbonibacillus altaicus TaxID=2163959 RepID=A0A2R6XX81_9BACL|nr:MAG: hypothetical protein BSOLF_1033 [Candidatus Carbobacillus altaicus]
MLAPNTLMALEAHLAVPLGGWVLVPINIRLNAHEIAYILDHAETKVLLVDASLWAEQASMLKERKMLQVVIVDQLASFEPYEENQKLLASRGRHGNHETHVNHETYANQKRHEKHDTQTDYERPPGNPTLLRVGRAAVFFVRYIVVL